MANDPRSGYDVSGLMSSVVSQESNASSQRQTNYFENLQYSTQRVESSTGTSNTLNGSAINQAVQSARSASDKLNTAFGGKLSSSVGSGLSKLGSVGSKVVRNLSTGEISTISQAATSRLSGSLSSSVGSLLGNTLSRLSDSAGRNLSAARIAPGFLTTGPEDNTLVTDVYGVSDQGILNDVGSKVSAFASDAFSDLRRSPGLLTDLVGMASGGNTGWSISKTSLADRIVNSLGGRSGIVNNLSNRLRSTFSNGQGLSDDIFNVAVAYLGEDRRSFRTDNIQDARDVYSMVNQVTTNSPVSNFFDVGSESALLSGTMREAIALGVPGTVETLVANAKDSEVAYNALYANLLVAIEYSDLDAILLMLDNVGVNGYLSQVPDAVPRLLQNYKLPTNTSSAQYDAELTALLAVLVRFSPTWGSVIRGSTAVDNLTAFSQLSDDAKTLMLRDETLQIPVLIGPTYGISQDLLQELQTYYPLVPLTAQTA